MLKGEESKKCKGVKKSNIKKSITHEDYKKCLFTGKEQLQRMNYNQKPHLHGGG